MPPDSGPLTGEWRSNAQHRWWYSPDATPYGRASGHSKYLDDKSNLIEWAAAQAAVGVVLDAAARSEVVALVNEFDKDPWNKGNENDGNGKDRLKKAVERARETAGSNVASTAGTEFHQLAEIVNAGRTPAVVQDHLVPLLTHYQEAVAPLEFLRMEGFVVQDDLKIAGSFDYLIRLPEVRTFNKKSKKWELHPASGQVVIGDLKTGKRDPDYPLSPTVQKSIYANSVLYDQATGVRTELHPDMNRDWGLLVHFPIMTKDPKVRMYLLDLKFGWQAAIVGDWVRLMRKTPAANEVRFAPPTLEEKNHA